jgi:alkylation response protein AidB-like acyl-CoA dehydrogenase
MFHLTEEQALLKQAADGYFSDLGKTNRSRWSLHGWQCLASELGILAAPFPEELGGVGGGVSEAMIIMEMLGQHLIVHPYLQTVIMAGRIIAGSGGPRRKAVIEAIGSGECVIAVVHREPRIGHCITDVVLRAEVTPTGGFVLRGDAMMVRTAPWATHLLVVARTRVAQTDADGISLFLIDRDRSGIVFSDGHTIDGYAVAETSFAGVRADAKELVGPLHGGLPLLRQMLDGCSAGLCAEAVGLMRSMIELTADYARQRKQFGTPLSSFQVLQHRLVDMRLKLEHSISMSRAAALALDAAAEDRSLIVSGAKYFVGRALNFVGRSAVQIHGAVGLMEETPIARYFKRATVIQGQGGSTEYHLSQFAERAGATLFDAMGDSPDLDIVARIVGSGRPEGHVESSFRAEVRAFLTKSLTPELKESASWETGAFATPDSADEWQRRLNERGWAAPSWPEKFGGPGWMPRQRQIFEEELAKAAAPRLPAMGLQMCAPVLMRYGTEAQKAYFLPRILSGAHRWCQGYSEPNAGSDLANVRILAVRDGDHYVLNGSKIWTTFAQYANWIFLLARTCTSGKPQAGITFLLAPMDTPGIKVRPLISMSGDHEVNQVFFDEVRVPIGNRVGEENQGWGVAKYLLEFERGVGHQVPSLVVDLSRVRDIAYQETGSEGKSLWMSQDFRRRFAELETQTLAIRLTEERLIYGVPAGQHVGDASASLMKLAWSETGQEIDELMIEALGPYAAVDQEEAFARRDRSRVFGPDLARIAMRRYLNDRVLTIAGGTSEILRNILAKKMLAL